MIPKTIGILGGAGPLAGVALLEQIFSLAGSLYGCKKDLDFPKVFFLSFPFSEMLTAELNADQLCEELRMSLDQLRSNGAEVLAIACNTLHIFLDSEDQNDLISLPKTLASQIPPGEIPLVLCTSTSKRFALHKRFFPCRYPEKETQVEIDRIIDLILSGSQEQLIAQEFLSIVDSLDARTIVLGCTELSLLRNIKIKNKRILDPLGMVASKLLEKSFSKN